MSDLETAQAITDQLVAEFAPQRVVWFGSRANGAGRADSDFDLLVVADTTDAFGKRHFRANWATRHIAVAKDIMVVTPTEHRKFGQWRSSVVASAEATGRVLYDFPA